MTSDSHVTNQPRNLSDSGESAENDSFSSFLTAAILALLPVIYFAPMLLSGLALLPGDEVMKILGERILLGKIIAAGRLPLWNPYTLAGAPLLANGYSGAFYPPNWIFALFSPVTATNIMVITTFYLSLIGSYLYGRRIGMTRLGGIICGIAFTFSGFMIAEMGIGPRLAAAAWLPWVLLAVESLRQKGSWRWVTLGSIFLALQFFAGDPPTSFFTILICLLIVVGRGKHDSRQFIRNAVAMFVCGLLLSMVQIVPLRELALLAAEKGFRYETFANPSFTTIQVLKLIIPVKTGGNTLPGELSYPAEFYIYFGLLTLILTIVALYGRRGNKQVSFWTITGLLSLYLAFSNKRQLFYYLPYNDFLNDPAIHLYLFSFSLAVLAGLGASYIAKVEPKIVSRILKWISPAFIAIALLAFLVAIILTDITYTDGLLSLAFTAMSLLAVRAYAQRRNILCAVLLVFVFMADLMTFGLAFHRERNESITDIKERLQDPPTVQFIKSHESDLNSFRIIGYSAKAQGVNYDLLDFPNLSLARGLQSINGIEELRSAWHAQITGDIELDESGITPNLFSPGNQWLNLLNVKYCLLEENSFNDEKPGSERGNSLDFIRTHWRRVGRFAGVSIYENGKFLPRAWFVKRLAVAKESEIAQIISSGSMTDGSPFDPNEIALLPGEYYQQSDAKLPAIGDPVDARAEVMRYEPNRIELNTRNDQPGFLVLSELYYRGWGARIDGKKASVELVNNALRGIAVPAGEHRVEFRYLAQSMYNGASYLLS
ncbi:MAG: YfhO family protein, partial [Blastocatellia bacterium]|nr:YfhO family protein [Blastocatellia bacterium]